MWESRILERNTTFIQTSKNVFKCISSKSVLLLLFFIICFIFAFFCFVKVNNLRDEKFSSMMESMSNEYDSKLEKIIEDLYHYFY